MIRAISVEMRPRTLPSASMMNHFGSMSPCFGKYVRMTLLNTPRKRRDFDLRRTGGAGENCSVPNVIQRQPHTFPAEGGETVTLPNRARQGIHSLRHRGDLDAFSASSCGGVWKANVECSMLNVRDGPGRRGPTLPFNIPHSTLNI